MDRVCLNSASEEYEGETVNLDLRSSSEGDIDLLRQQSHLQHGIEGDSSAIFINVILYKFGAPIGVTGVLWGKKSVASNRSRVQEER